MFSIAWREIAVDLPDDLRILQAILEDPLAVEDLFRPIQAGEECLPCHFEQEGIAICHGIEQCVERQIIDTDCDPKGRVFSAGASLSG